MKKITFILSCIVASAGVMNAQEVQLPAAYYNNPTSVLELDLANPMDGSPRLVDTNVTVPFTGTYGNQAGNRTTDLIYDNGPVFSVAGTPNLSILEDLSLGMSTFGAGAQSPSGNSLADDVILTEGYDITSIDVYAYQTGSVPPSITGVFLQVWNGDPSNGGAVIWGDMSTNILGGAMYAGVNRVLESAQTNTDRQIQKVTADTDGLSLLPGTYWIEYSFEGSGASGPWAPPIVITGETTTGNAMQNLSQTTGWQPLVDVGPQGLPFQIYGTPTVGIKDNVLAGFNFFPNPTSSVLNLSATKNIESVSIINQLGQTVMTVKVDAMSSIVNIESLATGNYLMRVSVGGQSATYKITKK